MDESDIRSQINRCKSSINQLNDNIDELKKQLQKLCQAKDGVCRKEREFHSYVESEKRDAVCIGNNDRVKIAREYSGRMNTLLGSSKSGSAFASIEGIKKTVNSRIEKVNDEILKAKQKINSLQSNINSLNRQLESLLREKKTERCK